MARKFKTKLCNGCNAFRIEGIGICHTIYCTEHYTDKEIAEMHKTFHPKAKPWVRQ